MLSNATNQPKYMCPRGLIGPPAVTLTKYLKYKKRLLLRCIHHFKSDLINNMYLSNMLHDFDGNRCFWTKNLIDGKNNNTSAVRQTRIC